MPDTAPPAVLPAEPVAAFDLWFQDATRTEPNDPNAMTLATVGTNGQPSARIVLLKEHDNRGFVFYTNKQSRKGEELTVNPKAALLFHWKTLGRQVRIEGTVEDVTNAEADAYYATRPRVSRLGAWASQQSRPLASRAELEQRLAEVGSRFHTQIPRPPHWSGYRLRPVRFEFWQDGAFRLHDRTIYTPSSDGWVLSKLYP